MRAHTTGRHKACPYKWRGNSSDRFKANGVGVAGALFIGERWSSAPAGRFANRPYEVFWARLDVGPRGVSKGVGAVALECSLL